MNLLFLDLKITGLDKNKHGIHEISGKIIIDGIEQESFNYKVRPAHNVELDGNIIDLYGVNKDEILDYPHMHSVFPLLISRLYHHTKNQTDNKKYFIVGYNSLKFDASYLFNWFKVNGGSNHFNDLFWNTTIDVMVLAAYHLMEHRHLIDSFDINTVAKYMQAFPKDINTNPALQNVDVCEAIYNAINPAKY